MEGKIKVQLDSIRSSMEKNSFVVSMLMSGVILIALYHICSAYLFEIAGIDALKSFLMHFFGVYIPGLAIYMLCYRYKQTILGALAVSYALGYASNIVSYFLLVPFGGRDYVSLFVIFVAIVSLVIIWKRRETCVLEKFEKKDIIFWGLFIIYLYLTVVNYSGCNMSPRLTDSAWYPEDFTYWLENAASLAIGFPAIETRVHLNSLYYYHYFSSLQLAYESLATGIDLFTLGSPLFALDKCIIYFGSFYVLFHQITKRRWLQLLGIVGICFCTGFEGTVLTSYVSHTWTHPFGFDIGLAFGAFFLHLFYLQLEEEKFDIGKWIISVGTLGICVGLKAPVGALVIVAAGIVCIYWLIKRQYKKAFLYGIGLLVVFFVVAIGCVGLMGNMGTSVTGSFSLWATIKEHAPYFTYTYDSFLGEWPEWMKGVLVYVLYCIYMHPLIIGLYIFGAISIIVDKNMRTAQNIGLFLGGVAGLALGLFNIQPGHSQIYFSMAAIVPCIALGLIWLENRCSIWDNVSKRMAAFVCSILVLVQMCAMAFQGYTYWGRGLASSYEMGYRNLFDRENAKQAFNAYEIQKEDLDALEWIRENTSIESVVLTDRCVLLDAPFYMYYGTFTERQMYLEGDVYYRDRLASERAEMRTVVINLFANSEEALQRVKKDGVNYIVQTKWLTPDFSPNSELVSLVFSGETINVYEIKSE